MGLTDFAMLASIIASLVTVPVASASLSGNFSAAGGKLLDVSEEEMSDVPREISQSLSSGSMEKTVRTAFGEARFSSESGRFISQLERPTHRIKVVKQSDIKRQVYQGSSVRLEVRKSSDDIESTCETPNGVLEKTTDQGDKESEFSGVKRFTVEENCQNARKKLESGAQKLARISADVGVIDRQVEIVGLDEDEESTTLKNKGPIKVYLANWTLSDSSGNSFEFDSKVLEPGSSLKVYSGDASEDCDEDQVCWDSSSIWNSGGDTATLRDAESKLIDKFSYGEE
ncbi:MAG: lamin tail domain-containing protein [Candidatus Nanohaloarchaea archaeon]|nr:lamin tail domain-containing protein [Candidatus Nanohaloarchaea archaeon]